LFEKQGLMSHRGHRGRRERIALLFQSRSFVSITLPTADKKAIYDTLKTQLTNILDIRIEKQKKNLWVLRKKNGAVQPPLSQARQSEMRWNRTVLHAIKQPISGLVKYLSTMYHVVDETGLKGEYDLSFSWDVTAKHGLEDGLATLGLEIVKAEREIDMYIVNHKNSSSQ
jgi:uncharacterized protein (TIGR03435 family)